MPFVILSSHGDRETIKAALFAGAFDYILKPFDEDRLRSVLERALAQRAAWMDSGGAPVRQPTVPFRPPMASEPSLPPSAFVTGEAKDVLARSTKVVSVRTPTSADAADAARSRGPRWLRRLLGR